VPGLYLEIGPARYFAPLRLLQKRLAPTMFTKSASWWAWARRRGGAAGDGRSARRRRDFLTIGQYLQPNAARRGRAVPPDEFKALQTTALAKGFRWPRPARRRARPIMRRGLARLKAVRPGAQR
jgi:lipoate synthase